MKRSMMLAAAVALVVPVMTLAQEEKGDRVVVKRLGEKAAYDERTRTVVHSEDGQVRVEKLDDRTEYDPKANVLIRIKDVPEKERAELEVLRKKILADAEAQVTELKRAQDEVAKARVEKEKAKTDADVARKWTTLKMKTDVEKERAAFLGVGSSAVPQVLREQLQLPKGVGLVVDAVEAGSPAEAAGIRRFDVLHKLDDQLLINTQQLAVLVRSMKPGESVKVSLYRGGKEQTVTVKLAEKELPVLGDGGEWRAFELPELPRFTKPLEMPDLKNWTELRKDADGNFGIFRRKLEGDGKRIIVTSDEDLSVTLSNENGRQHLKVLEDGKVLFDGPFDTREDRDKLPEQLRGKIRVMEDAVKWNPELNLRFDGKLEGGFKGLKVMPEIKFDRDLKMELRRNLKDGDTERREEDRRVVQWSDDGHQISVEQRDGKKTLVAKDKEGKEIFNGPIDTPEQRQKLPESLRETLDSGKWQSVMKKLED